MRKWTWAVAVVAVGVLAAATALAGHQSYKGFKVVHVIANGKPVQSEVPGINFYGTTLLPVRAVAEAMGAKVGWDAATSTVTLTMEASGSTEAAASLQAELAAAKEELVKAKAEAAAARAELEGYLKANKPAAAMPITATSKSGIVFTLHGMELTRQVDTITEADAGKIFVVVDVSIHNGSQQAFEFNPLYIKAVDTDSRRYDMEATSLDDHLQVTTIAAGDRMRGRLAFQLPEAAPLSQLRLDLDVFGKEQIVLQVR